MSEAVRGGLPGFLDALKATHARGESAVFGIVFATAGSTYQKPGALVLLDESGLRHGVISGGCLEPELEERARDVHRTQRADIVDFDMRSDDDAVFGSGTGCHGRVRLLLIPQRAGDPLTSALTALGEGTDALDLHIAVSGDDIGAGNASLGAAQWRWSSSGRESADSFGGEIARLRVASAPRVLLLGAGAETIPFQAFARQLGWLTCAVEHRGRWLGFVQRAGVDELIDAAPQAAAERWASRRFDAAVLMSHNYSVDLTHLALCARTDIGYIGLLGPAARRDELLGELGVEMAASLRDRLHAPVGLPLGGSGPGVLALSIAAELQSYFAKRAV